MAFFDKFPYTNFQEINLDWIIKEVSKVRDNRDASDASAAAALESETNAKASELAAAASQQAAAESEQAAAGSEAASAEYLEQIGTHTAGAVADWLEENLQPTTPPVDESLTVSGAAADAKVTGDRISDLNQAISQRFDAGYNIFNGVFKNAGISESNGNYYTQGINQRYAACEEFFPVESGETYVLSCSAMQTAATSTDIMEYADDKSFIKFTNIGSFSSSRTPTITVTSTTKFIRVFLYGPSTVASYTELIPTNFQIAKGSVAPTYQPYGMLDFDYVPDEDFNNKVDDFVKNNIWNPKKEYTLHRGNYWYGLRINKSTNTSFQTNAKSATTIVFELKESVVLRVSGDYTLRVITRPTASVSSYTKVIADDVSDTDVYVTGGQYVQAILTYTGADENLPLDVNTALKILCDDVQLQFFDSWVIKLDRKTNIDNLYHYADKLRIATNKTSSTTGYMTSSSEGESYNLLSQFYNEEAITIVWAATVPRDCFIQYDDNTIVQLINGVPLSISAKSTWRIIIPVYFSSAGGILRQLAFMTVTRTADNYDPAIVYKQNVGFNMKKTWLITNKILSTPSGFTAGALQDGDKYGDYLILFRANVWIMYIVSISTNTVIASTTLTEEIMGHANDVSFTRQFLNEGDNIPLLLVSHYNVVQNSHKVHVYHIANDYTVTLVNTITVEAETERETGFIYDHDTNCLVSIGYKNDGGVLFNVFTLPKNIDFSTIETIGSELITNRFINNEIDISSRWFQGATIANGKMFVATNNANLVDAKVYVFDIFDGRMLDVLVSCLPDVLRNNEVNTCYVNEYSDEYSICVLMNNAETYEISTLNRGYNTRTSV